jgi:acylphosphatase
MEPFFVGGREKVATHIIVHGRVQGVGYRVWTAKQAQKYGLNGWVRNLQSGSVEILVTENESELAEFIQGLHKGPVFAKVEQVVSKTVKDAAGASQFSILETAPLAQY